MELCRTKLGPIGGSSRTTFIIRDRVEGGSGKLDEVIKYGTKPQQRSTVEQYREPVQRNHTVNRYGKSVPVTFTSDRDC